MLQIVVVFLEEEECILKIFKILRSMIVILNRIQFF